MLETIGISSVPVNQGRLLENQLMKWQGGSNHPRGIAEYISNSDDSYRRLGHLLNQNIIVEIHCHSKTGKKIDKLMVKDFAEGMSFDDLESRFFQYFESFSGREKGEKVTGRFGTGGKAYAIMNFRHCWITSVKDGYECKAWFKWDYNKKEIIKAYAAGGYKNKQTDLPNGTTVELISSINVNHPLPDFILHLEKLARIRHILRNQKVIFRIIRREKTEEVTLKYSEPDPLTSMKQWKFPLPETLKNGSNLSNDLILRYFEKPLGENAFIEISDGVSSVADFLVKTIDGRPFSSYINGSITVDKLMNSVAVKENRRGLEEGDDLTEEIIGFLKEKVSKAITEVEDFQRKLDKQKRLNAANEKLSELSKFLSKQDLKFKLEIKELKKRLQDSCQNTEVDIDDELDQLQENNAELFRRPTPQDLTDYLVKGKWIDQMENGSDSDQPKSHREIFFPDTDGEDLAVKINNRRKAGVQERKQKQGLKILFSNDLDNPESPTFKEYDDPISDRDMVSKGIIWINAVHPIIVKYGSDSTNDQVRDENIANFVLMIVAQYYAQKESELQAADEPFDPLLLFRKHFFRLQIELRADSEITYFEKGS